MDIALREFGKFVSRSICSEVCEYFSCHINADMPGPPTQQSCDDSAIASGIKQGRAVMRALYCAAITSYVGDQRIVAGVFGDRLIELVIMQAQDHRTAWSAARRGQARHE